MVKGEISSPFSNVTLLRHTSQQREVEDFFGTDISIVTPVNQISDIDTSSGQYVHLVSSL